VSQNYLVVGVSMHNPIETNFLTPVQDTVKREYDYTRLLSLTAGFVVATRLSEDPSVLRHESQQDSQCVPAAFSPLSLTFPDTRSYVRDVWEELLQSLFRVGLQHPAHFIQ